MQLYIWGIKILRITQRILSHLPARHIVYVLEEVLKLCHCVVACGCGGQHLGRLPEQRRWQQPGGRGMRYLLRLQDLGTEREGVKVVAHGKHLDRLETARPGPSQTDLAPHVLVLPRQRLLLQKDERHGTAHAVSNESDGRLVVCLVCVLHQLLEINEKLLVFI